MTNDPDSILLTIAEAPFTKVRFRDSYDVGEVHAFLERLAAAVRAGEPIRGLVADARFTLVRWREAYDTDEVDRFRQRIVEATGRQAAGLPAPSVIQEQRSMWSRLRDRG